MHGTDSLQRNGKVGVGKGADATMFFTFLGLLSSWCAAAFERGRRAGGRGCLKGLRKNTRNRTPSRNQFRFDKNLTVSELRAQKKRNIGTQEGGEGPRWKKGLWGSYSNSLPASQWGRLHRLGGVVQRQRKKKKVIGLTS